MTVPKWLKSPQVRRFVRRICRRLDVLLVFAFRLLAAGRSMKSAFVSTGCSTPNDQPTRHVGDSAAERAENLLSGSLCRRKRLDDCVKAALRRSRRTQLWLPHAHGRPLVDAPSLLVMHQRPGSGGAQDSRQAYRAKPSQLPPHLSSSKGHKKDVVRNDLHQENATAHPLLPPPTSRAGRHAPDAPAPPLCGDLLEGWGRE